MTRLATAVKRSRKKVETCKRVSKI